MSHTLPLGFSCRPSNTAITLQLGGAYVVDGPKLLFAHMDKASCACVGAVVVLFAAHCRVS